MSINKEQTCYGCEDRHIGCHAECEGYQKRRAHYDEQIRLRLEKRQERNDADGFLRGNAQRAIKRKRRSR